MKFGLFYEHQSPRPWDQETDRIVFNNALDQVELADQLGYDYYWEVEHHFLEEYSHSSAPEVFLGALTQRTKNIRLGHGVNLTGPNFNHPARVAERIGTLDQLSGGRLEWGTGESASTVELDGFLIKPEDKTAQWREGLEAAAAMTVCEPYPAHTGRFFSIPTRNIVPKPYQKPHTPIWLACSKRDSIIRAAKIGAGALVFGWVEPEQAAEWVKAYYNTIKSEECVPIGFRVNANIACVNAMSIHEDGEEAVRRGLDGFRYFGYSLAYYSIFGKHKPGVGSLWERFLEVKDDIPDNAGRGGIGTPAEVAEHVERYSRVGLDQLIFVMQSGRTKHEHVCDSLRLFAKTVMPKYKALEADRQKRKETELAPYIEAALKRRGPAPSIREEDIEIVKGPGVTLAEKTGVLDYAKAGGKFSDPTRGGSVPTPMVDLNEAKRARSQQSAK
jgi:alkanesulfonate monooxygenase SsuD/methylene tetrahydromethanopterin reductase-like flavin-dependent oxidoreductase (luciferase family)